MTTHILAYTLVPSPEHNLASHPENVDRFRHFGRILETPFADRLLSIAPQQADEADLTAVHPLNYLQALEQAAARGPGYIDYAPTYVTPASYRSALEAAGSTLKVSEAVIGGQAEAGFALVRPPGHHATPTRPMGFCLLNNIAIATRRAQAHGLRRVMIVDFDVHHGNGTQEFFEEDPSVLYVSTHQAGIYPGSGALSDIGSGEGRGSVVNLPLPAGAGDLAFAQITEQLIEPLADRFRPEMLLVSAGFDAHWRDPLAGLQLSAEGYYHLAAQLRGVAEKWCQGRVVFALEGGYDPEALIGGVLACLYGLAGEPSPDDPLGPARDPEPDISRLLENAAAIHKI